jgi:hypothetical protein
MDTTHDRVCTLAGERQLVLDEELCLFETGIDKVAGQDRKAPIPGANLSRRWVVTDLEAKLFVQDGYETPGLDLRSNTSDRVAVQRQDGSRKA